MSSALATATRCISPPITFSSTVIVGIRLKNRRAPDASRKRGAEGRVRRETLGLAPYRWRAAREARYEALADVVVELEVAHLL